MPEPKLKIRLLGVPDITYEGQSVRILRRQIRSLLFYLSANQGLVGRPDLILKFIPDDDEVSDEGARQRVRKMISLLHSALPEDNFLITRNDQVGVNHEIVDVDVVKFRSLYQRVEGALKLHRAGQALQPEIAFTLNQAIQLWQGRDTFLQGGELNGSSDLDNWQSFMRSELDNMREAIINHLALHALAIGDLETGVRWMRMALEITPYINEESVTLYLKTLKQLGRMNEALNIASLIQKRYDENEDDMPRELKTICNQILSRFSIPSGEEAAAWGKSLSIQTPFIGRHKEMNLLKKAYRDRGDAVVWGEVGQGKSRLVYEFYQSITPPPRLMVANCHQMEKDLPFQPLIDMFKQFITVDEWQKVDSASLMRLVQFIPEVVLQISREIINDDLPGTAPGLILEAIFQVLQSVSSSERLLIFLDNAQWCDESTLRVFDYLIHKQFFKNRGFLILTAVPGEQSPALDAFIKSIDPQEIAPKSIRAMSSTCEIISLNALNEQEVGSLVNYALGGFLPSETSRKLLQESNGNPFILIESIRWLVERHPGADTALLVDEINIPPSINNLMHTRLSGLEYQLREVLNSAAVIGNQFTMDSIAVVTGFKKEETTNALDQLDRLNLVKPVSKYDAIGGYTFTYPRMRSVLLNEMSDARKQLKHQRIAHYLESFSGKRIAQPSVLAQHFEAGGDYQNAFKYWLKAAEYARRTFSPNETIAAYKAASSLAAKQPDLFSDEQLVTLYSTYADVCVDQQDMKTLLKIGQFLLTLGNNRLSHVMLGCGLIIQSGVEKRRGSLSKALTTIENAVRHLKLTDHSALMLRAYHSLGSIQKSLNLYKESQLVFETAQQLAEDTLKNVPKDSEIIRALGYIENDLAMLSILNGSPQKAQVLVERAIERLEAHFDFLGVSILQLTLAEAQFQQGIFKNQRMPDQIDTGAVFQEISFQASTLIFYAHSDYMWGDLDESWRILDNVSRLCNTHQLAASMLRVHHLRASIFQSLEQYDQALAESEHAISLPRIPYYSLEAMLTYGMVCVLSGHDREGEKYINRVLTSANEYEFISLALTAETYKANIFSLRGDHKKACELLLAVSEKASHRSLKLDLMNAYYLYSLAKYRQGELSVTQRLLSSVAAQGKEMHCPWIEIKSSILLHNINLKQGLVDNTLEFRVTQLLDEMRRLALNASLKPAFDRFYLNSISNFKA